MGAPRGLGRGGEAPKDFTKPRQTIQSPNRQYKAPKHYTKPKNIRRKPKMLDKYLNILDKDLKSLTRVATNINLTSNIKYLIYKTTYLNSKCISINRRPNNRAL